VSPRTLLAIFAHPDDETSGAGGTIARYVREGEQAFVVTATRGELGALGTNGMVIKREDLPQVREEELRGVLALYGAQAPIFLDYRDQEVKDAPYEELVGKIVAAMRKVQPDIVITFGPRGISDHVDHIALHKAAVDAFHRYRRFASIEPKLYFVAIPAEIVKAVDLQLDGVETQPTHMVDISETVKFKLQALRSYKSQQDAQDLAKMFEEWGVKSEHFHRAWPNISQENRLVRGLW